MNELESDTFTNLNKLVNKVTEIAYRISGMKKIICTGIATVFLQFKNTPNLRHWKTSRIPNDFPCSSKQKQPRL